MIADELRRQTKGFLQGKWEQEDDDPSIVIDSEGEWEHECGEFGVVLASYPPHVFLGIYDGYDGMEAEICVVQNAWSALCNLVEAVEHATYLDSASIERVYEAMSDLRGVLTDDAPAPELEGEQRFCKTCTFGNLSNSLSKDGFRLGICQNPESHDYDRPIESHWTCPHHTISPTPEPEGEAEGIQELRRLSELREESPETGTSSNGTGVIAGDIHDSAAPAGGEEDGWFIDDEDGSPWEIERGWAVAYWDEQDEKRAAAICPDKDEAEQLVREHNDYVRACIERNNLTEENERLRGALEPFASIDISTLDDEADSVPIYQRNDTTITVGDIRAAAAALAGGEKDE